MHAGARECAPAQGKITGSRLDETRHLAYHRRTISREFVNGMLDFQQATGLISAPVACQNLDDVRFNGCWRP